MPPAQLAFAVSLLSEADLLNDPFPDCPWKVDVTDGVPGQEPLEAVSIRATPEVMDDFFAQYRALRLGLVARGKQRAQGAWEATAQQEAIKVAFSRPVVTDPAAHTALLVRLRDALQREL